MASRLQAKGPLPGGSALRYDGLGVVVAARGTILQLDRPGGSALPPAGRCLRQGQTQLLSIGPNRYLVLDPGRDFDAAVDVSSAWTRLVFEGVNAAALLSKGCMLDLHPRAFPAGACAVTGFARMRAVLWRPGEPPRYDMLIGRSHALSLWKWLSESAAAFGVGASEKAGAE